MKKYFDLKLEGKDWAKPFIVYWILYLIFSGPMSSSRWWQPESGMGTGAYGGLSIVFTIVMVIISSAYTIKLARIAVPKLSIDGKAFGFQGAEGKFIGLNIGGLLLSIITISIYMPWYIAKITRYLASETEFDSENPDFLGKGGKLLGLFILFFWIPVIIIGAVIGFGSARAVYHGGMGDYPAGAAWAGVLLFFLLIPFMYIMYRWYINFSWKDFNIKWETKFWPSVGYILGQCALTAVTAGIYWPAAMLKLYRYFSNKTVVVQGDVIVGHLGFDGSIKKGFGLLWGQALLSIITIGFYLPWAYPKVGRWIAGSTYYTTASQVNE